MPREDGYTKYTCHHCGRVEFINERTEQSKAAKWKTHPYVNQDDVLTEEVICDLCEPGYKAMRSEADAYHNSYISPKKED